MANYCTNKLLVKGDVTQLEHFLSKVRGENDELILEGVFPVDIQIDESMKDLDEDDFEAKYEEMEDEWKDEFWGTTYVDKCEFNSIARSEVVINFYSAWSPPDKWVIYAAKQYGKLEFKLTFKEEGIGYNGVIECNGPNIIRENKLTHLYPKDLYKWNINKGTEKS